MKYIIQLKQVVVSQLISRSRLADLYQADYLRANLLQLHVGGAFSQLPRRLHFVAAANEADDYRDPTDR